MKTWSPKSLLLLALLLAQPALAGTDSAVLAVRPDSTLGTIQVLSGDASRLSGWIWIEPGEMFVAGDPALVRIVARDGATIYTDPYPIGDKVSRIAVEEDALLFADGFEAGSAWTWSAVEGQDIVTEAQSRMAATSVKWFVVDHLIGLDSGGSEVDVLLSERIGGGSASTDTPASVPFRPVLRDPDPVDWEAIRTSSGWPDIGGVLKHTEYVVTANNRRLRSTRVGPLDDLASLNFKDQSIVRYSVRKAWNSSAKRWEPQSLANSTILWRGTISDGSFSGINDNTFSYRVRERTTVDLQIPTSPFVLYGAGVGVLVEDGGSYGSGARISRADVSTMRGTGSQWFAWGLAQFGQDRVIPTPASEYTFWESPICRLRKDPSGDALYGTVKVELLDSASSWTTVVGGQSLAKDEFTTFLVNYNSSTNSAELFVNGVSVGSTSISGGLKASASSGAAEWYANPSHGTGNWVHYWFRHGTRLLAAAEIKDRGLYAFDHAQESSLTTAIEFVEATGTEATDYAALANGTGTPAVLTSFADANGAWQDSALGDISQARSRVPVVIGRPFMAKMTLIGAAMGIYTAGYNAGGAVNTQRVTANGARLAGTPYSFSHSVTFRTTGNEIDGVRMLPEMAVDQVITWTGDSDATNDGNYTIKKILIDPRTYNYSGSNTATISVAESFTAGTIAGTWSTVTTAQWSEYSTKTYEAILLSPIRVSNGATDNMAQGLVNGGTERLAEDALTNFGPEVAVTLSNLAAVTVADCGWQGSPNATAIESIDALARVTPGLDYGPSVVHCDTSGTWHLTGADLSPSSATHTWDASRISSATVAALPGDYDAVRVRFAKAWSLTPPGDVSAGGSVDPLASEVAVEWREVTAGTGSKELILEAYFLKRADAQSFADAIYSMLSGALYAVELNPGVKPSEAAMAPLSTVDVTWPGGALASGAKGIVAAWKVNPDKSARALVFFGSL